VKYLFLILVFIQLDGITKIARINQYKKEANQAYMASNYKKASEKYRYLFDSLEVKEDPVILNLAHSYYQLNDTTNAMNFYTLLTESKNSHYKSVAYQQLGVIEFNQKNYNLSLRHLKNALKADPENADARYNYELLKKMMRKDPGMQDQKKDDELKPSEYAKKLKEQADLLVRNNRFADAYSLMMDGLQVDKTVGAYNEFIGKLKDVVEVETGK